MWLELVMGVIRRPWIIVIVSMGVFMGYQWVQINSLKGDVVSLKSEIVRIESDFKTCKVNESDLLGAIKKQKESVVNLENSVAALQGQVTAEQKTSIEWKRKYENRPIIERVKEVPVIQYVKKGVVVDEETSKEYVKYFNHIFAD